MTDSSVTGRRPLAGLVVVGVSLSIWWPAFTLGAWGQLFFEQNLAVWVASSAAFIVVAMQPRPSPHRIRRLFALAVPSLWLFLAFARDDDSLLIVIADLLALIVAFVGMPFTAWVLLRIFWPDFGAGAPPRVAVIGVGAIALIGVLSFVLGLNQASFLTCEDFELSGNSDPPGCVHEP